MTLTVRRQQAAQPDFLLFGLNLAGMLLVDGEQGQQFAGLMRLRIQGRDQRDRVAWLDGLERTGKALQDQPGLRGSWARGRPTPSSFNADVVIGRKPVYRVRLEQ